MPVARQVFDLAADDTEDGSELHDGWMTSTRSVRRPLSQVGQNPDTRSRLSMSPSLALPTRPLACRLHPLLGDVRSVILTATTWLAPLDLQPMLFDRLLPGHEAHQKGHQQRHLDVRPSRDWWF